MNTIQAQAAALLLANGYTPGEYNPHSVRAWEITNEYGHVCIALGSHAQEALDSAVDNDLMQSFAMDAEDYAEYAAKGWDDSYALLGNASEPYWTDYMGITEIAL